MKPAFRYASSGRGVLVFVWLAAWAALAHSQAADLSRGDAAFSVGYFKQAFNRSVNAVVSPVAVRITFSALYEVATDAKIKDAVRQAFHLAPEPADARQNAVAFTEDVRQSPYVNMSFAVFKTQEPLSSRLTDAVRDIFKLTEPQTVAFADAKAVVERANRWAEEATGGLLRDFLAETDIDVTQELLLLNALYLRANWAQRFPLEHTASETFEFVDGPAPVELMRVSMQVLYRAYETFHAVQIPYSEDSDLAMWILLPHRGGTLDGLVGLLSAELLDELEGSFAPTEVDIWLPRFAIRYSHNPRDVLAGLGHTAIFEGNNFDAFESHASALGGLKQSTFIKVDETGTEAAAATSVGVTFRVRNTQFLANKPFLFIIRKISTDTILFIGHYSSRDQARDGQEE